MVRASQVAPARRARILSSKASPRAGHLLRPDRWAAAQVRASGAGVAVGISFGQAGRASAACARELAQQEFSLHRFLVHTQRSVRRYP